MPSALELRPVLARNAIEVGPETVAQQAARALLAAGAVKFDFENGYRFVSGIRSPIYIDSRLLFNKPEGRNVIARLLADRATQLPSHEVVAGTAIGGIMPALLLAQQLFAPFVYVRKAAKEHGTAKQVEAGDVQGRHVLLVEDLVNLGTSSLPAVEALRANGARVTDVLTITTYGFTKTATQFADAGVQLHALTTVPTIIELACADGRINRHDADQVLQWLAAQDKNNANIE